MANFGVANYTTTKYRNQSLIYNSRLHQNSVYTFSKKKNGKISYWKCIGCDKLKSITPIRPESVPLIRVENNLILDDPDRPRNAHFCSPISVADIEVAKFNREIRQVLRNIGARPADAQDGAEFEMIEPSETELDFPTFKCIRGIYYPNELTQPKPSGEPSVGDLTAEEEKIVNIYGKSNSILTDELGGFDAVLVPPINSAILSDCSGDDLTQPHPNSHVDTETPKAKNSTESSSIRKFASRKRKRLEQRENPNPLTKEELAVEVLKSELEKNIAEKQKYLTEIELINEQKFAAAAKKTYYESLAEKVQFETALLVKNNNFQFGQDDNTELNAESV